MPRYGVRVTDFDFDLPERLIAQHPRERGKSRLLVVDRRRGRWEESRVADLATWLRAGDLLVANDSRVFPARLLGRRVPGGGQAECLLLEELGGELSARQIRMESGQFASELIWWSLVNPGPKLNVGARIDFSDPDRAPGITLTADVIEVDPAGRRLVRLTAGGASVTDAIDRLG